MLAPAGTAADHADPIVDPHVSNDALVFSWLSTALRAVPPAMETVMCQVSLSCSHGLPHQRRGQQILGEERRDNHSREEEVRQDKRREAQRRKEKTRAENIRPRAEQRRGATRREERRKHKGITQEEGGA